MFKLFGFIYFGFIFLLVFVIGMLCVLTLNEHNSDPSDLKIALFNVTAIIYAIISTLFLSISCVIPDQYSNIWLSVATFICTGAFLLLVIGFLSMSNGVYMKSMEVVFVDYVLLAAICIVPLSFGLMRM
jgi:hypothetical protein